MNPFTHYHPSLGFYDSSNAGVIRQHIAAMQYANMQVGISSWWGQGSRTDQRVPLLLGATAGLAFRWSLYYEPEGGSDPSVAQINADLSYIKARYGGDPSFLRINGQFVVFVYAQPTDGCGMADRWKQANTVGAYVVLKVFPGYAGCASQPQAWHQYSPAGAEDSQAGRSFTISPGFYKGTEATPRLSRDINRWYANVRDMVNSHAPLQLVTTFSEWGEGTSVESASEWASSSGYGAYLDALHTNGGAGPPPTPAPTPVPTPTTRPTPAPSPTPSAAPSGGSPSPSGTPGPTSTPKGSGHGTPSPKHSSAGGAGSSAGNSGSGGQSAGGSGGGIAPSGGSGATSSWLAVIAAYDFKLILSLLILLIVGWILLQMWALDRHSKG